MITKKPQKDGTTKVTFALPDDGQPVAVVADFNAWDASQHPLKKRSNGVRSVAVQLPAGSVTRFRYVSAGCFFDDPDGDGVEPNGFGETHTLLTA